MSREIKARLRLVVGLDRALLDIETLDAFEVTDGMPVTLVLPEETSAPEGESAAVEPAQRTLADLSGRDIGRTIQVAANVGPFDIWRIDLAEDGVSVNGFTWLHPDTPFTYLGEA